MVGCMFKPGSRLRGVLGCRKISRATEVRTGLGHIFRVVKSSVLLQYLFISGNEDENALRLQVFVIFSYGLLCLRFDLDTLVAELSEDMSS